MTINQTALQWDNAIGLYIASSISSVSAIIAILVSVIIIVLTYITPNLHSSPNVLISSTCLCTTLNLIIALFNSFLFFTETTSSDWSCRIRGYLYYFSLNLVMYSYVIQAISRIFWTVLYRYRYLLKIKCHIYMIIFQICISFLFPLSTIITDDIVFRPFQMCLVTMKYTVHVCYLLTVVYIIPLLTIVILYAIIYRHIRRSTSNFRRLSHGAKRDAELARNIVILLSIFLLGGIPTVIYIIVSNKMEKAPNSIFLMAITSPSVAIAIEKMVTIMLNKEIRKVLKFRWIAWFPNFRSSTTRVQPFTHANYIHRQTIHKMSGMMHTVNVRKSQPRQPNQSNIHI